MADIHSQEQVRRRKAEGKNMLLAEIERAGLTYAQIAEKTGFSEWKVKAIVASAMYVPHSDMEKIGDVIYQALVENDNSGTNFNDDTRTVGQILRYGRENNRFSVKEAANMFGISTSALKGFENGSIYPDLALLGKMAERYKIKVFEQMEFVPEEEFSSTQKFGNIMMQRRKYLDIPAVTVSGVSQVSKIDYTSAEAGYIRLSDKDMDKICLYLQTTKENLEKGDTESSSADSVAGIFWNLRHAIGWKKEEMAKDLHLPLSEYSAIEKGKQKPSEELIKKLKDTFFLDPKLILAEYEEESAEEPIETNETEKRKEADKSKETEKPGSAEKTGTEKTKPKADENAHLGNDWQDLGAADFIQMIAGSEFTPEWEGTEIKPKRLKKLLTGQKYAKDKEILAMLHMMPDSKRQAMTLGMFFAALKEGNAHLYERTEVTKAEGDDHE